MKHTGVAELNLPWLRLYAAFTYPFACVPYLFFYYRDLGCSVADYGHLMAIYYLTMVVAEIPTGVLADLLGRKRAMALGPLILAAGFFVTFAVRTFGGFAVGEILMGLGHSILSGPPSALLFDSLRAEGREAEFLHHESRNQGWRLWGTGSAFLIGGGVAHWSGIAATIVLTTLLCCVASALALRVSEPRHVATGLETLPGAGQRLGAILRSAIAMRREPHLLWMLVYYSVLFFLLRFGFHTYTVYFESAEVRDPLVIGTFFFLLNVLAAACARWTPWLRTRLGERRLFFWLVATIALTLLVMAVRVHWALLVFFAVQQLPFGVHWSAIQSFVNHRIPSASRTTVLSAMSLVARLATAGLISATGVLIDRCGIQWGYAITGVVCAATLVPLFGRACPLARGGADRPD